MSQTEIHTGTLAPIQQISTHQELVNFVTERDITPMLYDSLSDYLEEHDIADIITEKWTILFTEKGSYSPAFCLSEKQMFKFEDYQKHEEYDLNIWNKRADGKIRFATAFYNGWTCFSEVIENNLKNIDQSCSEIELNGEA